MLKHSSDQNKESDHQGWNVLIFRQILLTSSIRNVWRMCILYQGLIATSVTVLSFFISHHNTKSGRVWHRADIFFPGETRRSCFRHRNCRCWFWGWSWGKGIKASCRCKRFLRLSVYKWTIWNLEFQKCHSMHDICESIVYWGRGRGRGRRINRQKCGFRKLWRDKIISDFSYQ